MTEVRLPTVSNDDFAAIDLFRDPDLPQDPYAYYEWLREQGPVVHDAKWDVWLINGYEEAIGVYHDQATWSNCNTVAGPFVKIPVPLEGDDISEIIEEHRDSLPFSDQLPSFDPPKHTAQRGLLMRLITPKRLKENEEFMWQLADRTIDEFFERRECEVITDYARPFTLMVVADLLGVPDEDRDAIREKLAGPERPMARFRASLVQGSGEADLSHKPLSFLYEQFTEYIEDRRRDPRDDIMTEMAQATFPDGTLPPVDDVMRIAANLFSAGGETTARLITMSLRRLAERPDLQEQFRRDPALIPAFVEEQLRIESPLKGSFRLARVPAKVGGIDLPAGTTVFIMNDAANRDPRQFENPQEFRLDRGNGRMHIGFGHGIHTCAGAPLARAETNVTIRRFLDRMDVIRVSEAHHGPAGARRFEYDPTYMLRGLKELHLEFTPAR
jgi:cytochrome P450 family 150 subfamily A5